MMKKYLGFLLCLVSTFAFGQATYNPSYTPLFTVASKPYGISQAAPVDGRSYKADSINFLWRPYHGTSEVLSYLNIAKYRTGQFPIMVNAGGTLNNNGTFTGGIIQMYWFRNGTADSNLVRWYTDSIPASGGTVTNVSGVNSTGFAWTVNNQTTTPTIALALQASQDLQGVWPVITVAKFNNELPSFYLNYNNLINTPAIPAQFHPIAGTNMSLAGTYPNITFNANFTGLFDTVATIHELITGSFGSDIVVVTDTFAGGIFRLQATPAKIDSGKVFPALGISDTSYWIRILNNGIGNNVEWYGAVPGVSTLSVAHANAIAIQRDMNANIDVFFPGRANFFIDSTLHAQNGQNIFGAKGGIGAAVSTSTVTTIDTVTAFDYAQEGDNNTFTTIHDLAINNTATGGVLNAGIVIARGFAHVDRCAITNFGYHGIWVTSHYLGNNTIADGVVIDQVFSSANGVDGIHVGGGDDNNLVTVTNCETTDNLNDGYFSGGNHNLFSNNNGTNNFGNDFEDAGNNNMWINNYGEGGRGDTMFVQSVASGGTIISADGFGSVYPTGPGLANNYAVQIGSYRGNYFTISGEFARIDTTSFVFLGADGGLQVIPVGCTICAPNRFLTEWDSSKFVFDMANADVYGLLHIGNQGLTNLDEYTSFDATGLLIGQPINGHPVAVSVGMRGNTSFGGAHALIGGQLFSFGEGLINFDFFERHSSSSAGIDAGTIVSTSIDTLSGTFRTNNFSGRNHVDPTTGLWSFYTFGGLEDPTLGGPIRFQNRDTTTALYIDPLAKHVGIEKFEPAFPLDVAGQFNGDSLSLTTFSPSPFTGGDSALVWNASTKRVHMVSPQAGTSLFAPTTGGSITLIKNQYNIVNPTGALLALTVTLPSSPSDKDYVKIKFVQAITTVTYAGGTVADGITSPVAGGYLELHYVASTSTWY